MLVKNQQRMSRHTSLVQQIQQNQAKNTYSTTVNMARQ